MISLSDHFSWVPKMFGWSSHFCLISLTKVYKHYSNLYCYVYWQHIVNLLGRAWASPTLVWLHLRKCVYACLRPYTVKFKWACLHFNIRKIKLMHLKSWWAKPEGLFLECSVGYLELRQLKLKYTLFATDHRWQVAHRQYKFWSQWWLRSLQIRTMQ